MTKRVILPLRLTEEMRDAADTAMVTCPQDGHAPDFSCGYLEAVAAAPASGKVTEAELEKAARALCERDIRNKRRFDTSPEHLEGMLPRSVDFHWRDYVPEARVVCAALGLEVE